MVHDVKYIRFIKCCIQLIRSLFLYFNYLVNVTAGGQVRPQWPSSLAKVPIRFSPLPPPLADLGRFLKLKHNDPHRVARNQSDYEIQNIFGVRR